MSTDLVTRATARELAAAFEQAERAVRESFARIVATEAAVNATFGAPLDAHDRIRISACGGYWRDNFKDADEAVRLMTAAAWSAIVDRLDLRRFMSIKRWEQLQKQLSPDRHTRGDLPEMPPITEESVMAFAAGTLGAAREMLQEAVAEVFEWLRPRGEAGRLKTNSQLEVPPKVILPWMIERGSSGFDVRYGRQQELVALERVFHALAGDGRLNVVHESELRAAIKAAKDGEGETDLFAFRACKNGNLHLTFLRPDLLDRFNALAGGKRLRPAPSEEDRLRAEIAKAKAENERLKKAAGRAA